MVSKVAVIALVGILAIPILLGYALNLEQITDTGYKTNDDSINVTNFLLNSTYSTNVKADVYELNKPSSITGYLEYENVGDTKTNYYINNMAVGHEQVGWVDFSGGLHFYSRNNFNYEGRINLNGNPNSLLITVNLDSLGETEGFYFYTGDGITDKLLFTKETIDDEIKWTIYAPISDTSFDIYYDSSINDNTYQIYTTYTEPTPRISSGHTIYTFTVTYHVRYVGHWPTFIGPSNYYMEYEVPAHTESVDDDDISHLTITANNAISGVPELRSPTIRIDGATFKGMEYQVIENKSYKPDNFKTNPSTTIKNISLYGTSLEFGGFTYTVSKEGKITIGSHEIPLDNLVLSSVPNTDWGYDNMIGNTVISNTASPSTITFNGKWLASITTTSQEEYEIIKTEWVAGSFAWDGIDQNFLMVGLLASLGAFIALGIYARRSRASIWPLLLVCGGAAVLFFTML